MKQLLGPKIYPFCCSVLLCMGIVYILGEGRDKEGACPEKGYKAAEGPGTQVL